MSRALTAVNRAFAGARRLAYGRVVATEAITVSLSEEELVRVDDAVAQGTFRDREDAIRVALSTLWRQREVEAEVGAAYKRAAEMSANDSAFDQVGLRCSRSTFARTSAAEREHLIRRAR